MGTVTWYLKAGLRRPAFLFLAVFRFYLARSLRNFLGLGISRIRK